MLVPFGSFGGLEPLYGSLEFGHRARCGFPNDNEER